MNVYAKKKDCVNVNVIAKIYRKMNVVEVSVIV
jgi:hypothetical protein